MAATAAVPQTLEVLREAAKVFDPADEVQNVKAVKQLHEQNKAAWRAEQESIAETIRGASSVRQPSSQNLDCGDCIAAGGGGGASPLGHRSCYGQACTAIQSLLPNCYLGVHVRSPDLRRLRLSS